MNEPAGSLEGLARSAAAGDGAALDRLILALKDDVYNLAMRMLGHPQDAEDATQEILLKVVTRLGSYRAEASLRTWTWRVASNHLISVRRGRREPEAMEFEILEGMLASGLGADVGPPPQPDVALLEEEVKLGCTQTMLICLDRPHRLAFILGDIFDLSSEEAGRVLEIAPSTFRKRLSRARRRMRSFMERNCGLVSPEVPCRCARQVGPSIQAGIIDPAQLVLATHPTRTRPDPTVVQQYEAIEGVPSVRTIFHSHPDYLAPAGMVAQMREMISASP